jgi:hypothetical protein
MRVAGRAVTAGAALLPGALVVLLGFQAGGFFPASYATVAACAAVALALRIVLAERPFAGVGPAAAVVAGALALLGVWTLLSAGWSHAPARALLSFERLLAYGLVFALLASLPGGERAAWTLRGVAAGIAIVCCASLVTRFAPDLWPTPATIANQRLDFPISYWNALGLLAGVGVILALHLCACTAEPRWVRVLAAPLMAPCACALYLTFSRGAIAATVLGLVVYALVGRPRAGLTALASAGVATAIALVHTYDAPDFARAGATASVADGHELGTIVLACCAGAAVLRALLLPLDAALERASVGAGVRRAGRIGLTAAVAVVLVGLVLGGAVGWGQRQAELFLHSPTPGSADLRDRLLVVSNNGRTQHWQVALDGFDRHPLHGTGAGTFANEWNRERHDMGYVLNAHSLYFETLGELGLIGLGLLVVALGALLVGLARRARGPDRGVAAAALAATVAWLAHVGVDWDWQLTAVTIWVFGLGAAVLAAPADGRPRARGLARPARVAIALGALLLAIPGVRIAQSEIHVTRSAKAFLSGDCRIAVDAGLSALEAVSVRTEPRELIAYCDVRAGQYPLAVRQIDAAVAGDPDDWQLRYAQAVVYGAAGRDPRAAAARAKALNPLEPRANQAVRAFATPHRRVWERRARRLPLLIR